MQMSNEEATKLFDYASRLYAEAKFDEALAVLEELRAVRQRSRRVLFARADCLHRLDRMDDALRLCDELIAYHDYEPAKKLRIKLEDRQIKGLRGGHEAGVNPFAATELDMDFDLPATKVGPPPQHIANKKARPINKTALLIIMLALIAGIIAAAFWLFLFRG